MLGMCRERRDKGSGDPRRGESSSPTMRHLSDAVPRGVAPPSGRLQQVCGVALMCKTGIDGCSPPGVEILPKTGRGEETHWEQS